MKVIDPKSVLIGVLITLLAFSTLGLRPKTDELGHLVVRMATYKPTISMASLPYLLAQVKTEAVTCALIMAMETNLPM